MENEYSNFTELHGIVKKEVIKDLGIPKDKEVLRVFKIEGHRAVEVLIEDGTVTGFLERYYYPYNIPQEA